MKRSAEAPDPGFDLDEDLFDFDELLPQTNDGPDADIDVEGIFAAFEEAEGERAAPPPRARDGAPGAGVPTPLREPRAALPAQGRPQAPRAAPARGESAAAAALEPLAPAGPAMPRAARAPLARGAIVILTAMTLLNAAVGVLTLGGAAGMKREVDEAALRVSETAVGIRDELAEQESAAREEAVPRAPAAPEEHAALDRAAQDVEAGSHARARERIYALLAIAERLPPRTREDIEARASFLIARAYHAQALAAEQTP